MIFMPRQLIGELIEEYNKIIKIIQKAKLYWLI